MYLFFFSSLLLALYAHSPPFRIISVHSHSFRSCPVLPPGNRTHERTHSLSACVDAHQAIRVCGAVVVSLLLRFTEFHRNRSSAACSENLQNTHLHKHTTHHLHIAKSVPDVTYILSSRGIWKPRRECVKGKQQVTR